MSDNIEVSASEAEDSAEHLRAKIIHQLKIYPVISPMMLQIGLGPSCKPKFWRPALQKLIDEGTVISTNVDMTTVTNRYNEYKLLHLVGTTYNVNQNIV